MFVCIVRGDMIGPVPYLSHDGSIPAPSLWPPSYVSCGPFSPFQREALHLDPIEAQHSPLFSSSGLVTQPVAFCWPIPLPFPKGSSTAKIPEHNLSVGLLGNPEVSWSGQAIVVRPKRHWSRFTACLKRLSFLVLSLFCVFFLLAEKRAVEVPIGHWT